MPPPNFFSLCYTVFLSRCDSFQVGLFFYRIFPLRSVLGLCFFSWKKTQDGRQLSSRKSHTSFRLAPLTALQ